MGRFVKGVAPIVVFGVALFVSIRAGVPSKLPGAALGSNLLLHVERASAALGTLGAVWLIGWRALHGHFPIKFGNIEYADDLAASADAADTHEKRIKLLENYLGLVDSDDDPLNSGES
jgi:hypothetical protein